MVLARWEFERAHLMHPLLESATNPLHAPAPASPRASRMVSSRGLWSPRAEPRCGGEGLSVGVGGREVGFWRLCVWGGEEEVEGGIA